MHKKANDRNSLETTSLAFSISWSTARKVLCFQQLHLALRMLSLALADPHDNIKHGAGRTEED